MERKQKIDLLYSIAKGIIKVESLQPQNHLLKMVMGSKTSYILNHIPCTKEEYEKLSEKSTGKKYEITLQLDHIISGRPMITSESQLIEQMKLDEEWS